jgi:hypothetical protein
VVLQNENSESDGRSGEGTFLVFRDGECIPLDGPMRVERLRGSYYLLGHESWVRCNSEAGARRRLLERVARLDPDRVAAEALELLADEAMDPAFGPS